jgi:hypothetical protein
MDFEKRELEALKSNIAAGDSFLLVGPTEQTHFMLKTTYDDFSQSGRSCFYFNSQSVKTPEKFFFPILRKKLHGDAFEKLMHDSFCLSPLDRAALFSRVYASTNHSPDYIFIHGLDELLFAQDCSSQTVIDSLSKKQDYSRSFGSNLRNNFLRQDRARFCASVLDDSSPEYNCTLANPSYSLSRKHFTVKHMS